MHFILAQFEINVTPNCDTNTFFVPIGDGAPRPVFVVGWFVRSLAVRSFGCWLRQQHCDFGTVWSTNGQRPSECCLCCSSSCLLLFFCFSMCWFDIHACEKKSLTVASRYTTARLWLSLCGGGCSFSTAAAKRQPTLMSGSLQMPSSLPLPPTDALRHSADVAVDGVRERYGHATNDRAATTTALATTTARLVTTTMTTTTTTATMNMTTTTTTTMATYADEMCLQW